jgi:bacterioferritin-associated ferredoxin
MIICSCNVLTDHDVRSAVATGRQGARNAAQLYGCLGCSVQCGRCARTVLRIMDEISTLHRAQSPIADDPLTRR